MNTDLRELYQDVILEHSKRPRNFRALDKGARRAEGFNPLCGDRVTIYVDVENGVLKEVTFQGSGCAISTAAASVMTEVLRGRSCADAEALFDAFHAMVTGDPHAASVEELGKLGVFAGVSEFPTRVKCAILAWHTLRAALKDDRGTVSTE